MKIPKRGEIWIADLGASDGCEQRGTRPVLIIQNDIGNKHSPTVIIASITDSRKRYMPTHVSVHKGIGLLKDSAVLLEQIRTIDKKKLDKKVATLDPRVMRIVDKRLMLSVGIEL